MQERVEAIAASNVPWLRRYKGGLTGPLSAGYSAAAFSALVNQRRSAGVVADTAVKGCRLFHGEFESLRKTHPDVIDKRVLTMSLHSTRRLRLNTRKVRRLAES